MVISTHHHQIRQAVINHKTCITHRIYWKRELIEQNTYWTTRNIPVVNPNHLIPFYSGGKMNGSYDPDDSDISQEFVVWRSSASAWMIEEQVDTCAEDGTMKAYDEE